MNSKVTSIYKAKEQAKRLRVKLAEAGMLIGHAQALELLAHQEGYRDWNTMRATITTSTAQQWNIGDRVQGTYLSRPFTAQVIGARGLEHGWFRLHLELENAVDVVTSEHFSNLRKRIRGTVGPKGHSAERTSDGKPQLQIDL